MKYVVVTGAYGGMGSATVEALKNAGYFVFALDKKSGNEEENVLPVEVDVTDEKSVLCAVEKIREVTDEIYAVIHYAGIYLLDSLVEIPTEDFERIFKINLFGVFCLNKALRPLLSKGSRIIMTTSELAPLAPLPFTGLYAITKKALDSYAFSLKMELQLSEIYVSVLRAGAVKTNMLGVSTNALERFCEKTELYKCNAKRFKKIVDSIEAKSISTKALAKKTMKILSSKKPRFSYSVNANFLLKLYNVLPNSLKFFVIKRILKD